MPLNTYKDSRKRAFMYYYAFLDENDICTQIYAMPAPISGNQFIAISTNDQSLIGQRFNRTTSEFEAVYYYAILDNRNVVTSVTYSTAQQAASATVLPITFAQYQTVVGMYWNGTEFVTPPISVMAVASTDEVNYKGQEKWLSTKLDEMDGAIAGNASGISTLSTALSTVAGDLQTVVTAMNAMATAIEGKANAAHTHTAADLSGVVKTVNGNAPDAEGNITITNSGMTAAEILAALKTVDGTGSGIDADTLDGLDSTAFALTNHSHDYAPTAHTHTLENVTGLVTALAGKSDTNHDHNTAYAPISHAHTIENVTGLATALSGKADTAALNSLIEIVNGIDSDVTDLEDALADKANTNHTHDEYISAQTYANGMSGKADVSHTHAISDISGLQSALNGKADASHTHSGYLPTSGGSVSGNLNVGGILKVNNQQSIFDSGTMITLSTNNRETMIAGSKIYSKTTISVSSDERLKEAINPAPTDNLAEMIDKLNVCTYNYIGSDEENVGIIAQELIRDNPTLADYFVRTDKDGYYSVKAADLVFPLIAAVQKLNKEVKELKK